MASFLRLAQPLDQAAQSRGFLDFAIGDCISDAQQSLLYNPAGSEGKMSDLGVSHLPLRQPDILAGCRQQAMRAVSPEMVEGGSVSQADGIVGEFLSPAPTV